MCKRRPVAVIPGSAAASADGGSPRLVIPALVSVATAVSLWLLGRYADHSAEIVTPEGDLWFFHWPPWFLSGFRVTAIAFSAIAVAAARLPATARAFESSAGAGRVAGDSLRRLRGADKRSTAGRYPGKRLGGAVPPVGNVGRPVSCGRGAAGISYCRAGTRSGRAGAGHPRRPLSSVRGGSGCEFTQTLRPLHPAEMPGREAPSLHTAARGRRPRNAPDTPDEQEPIQRRTATPCGAEAAGPLRRTLSTKKRRYAAAFQAACRSGGDIVS